MKTAVVEYIAADSLEEVLCELARGDTSVLAGGQSLVPEMTRDGAPPRRVVDINRVAGLDRLAETGGMLRVGPLVRHRTFESDAVGGALGDLMRVVVRHIGHPPIRARGTMLGSLAYAHPGAEWPVLAVTVGAQLVLTGPAGCRVVAAEQFFTGPFSTVRRPEELLTEARLPLLPDGTGVGYCEDRRFTIYPEAAAMAAVTMTGGVVSTAAIGLVNAGPCPVRARAAEKTLIGSGFSDAAITAAAEAAAEIDAGQWPAGAADQHRRRRAFKAQVRRALTQAREGR